MDQLDLECVEEAFHRSVDAPIRCQVKDVGDRALIKGFR